MTDKTTSTIEEMENDLRRTVSGSQWAPGELEAAAAARRQPVAGRPRINSEGMWGGGKPAGAGVIGGAAAKAVNAQQVEKALFALLAEIEITRDRYEDLLSRLDGAPRNGEDPKPPLGPLPLFTGYANTIGRIEAERARIQACNARLATVLGDAPETVVGGRL